MEDWETVFQLLHGDKQHCQVVIKILSDSKNSIYIDISNKIDELLPKIFHVLCTNYLISSKQTARTYAALCLSILCKKFSNHLIKLLKNSRNNENVMMKLDEFNFLNVISSNLNFSEVSDKGESNISAGGCNRNKSKLYDDDWIQKSRLKVFNLLERIENSNLEKQMINSSAVGSKQGGSSKKTSLMEGRKEIGSEHSIWTT